MTYSCVHVVCLLEGGGGREKWFTIPQASTVNCVIPAVQLITYLVHMQYNDHPPPPRPHRPLPHSSAIIWPLLSLNSKPVPPRPSPPHHSWWSSTRRTVTSLCHGPYQLYIRRGETPLLATSVKHKSIPQRRNSVDVD